MITTLLVIAGILYLALQLEDTFTIPSPLGLIALSFAAHYGFQQVPVLVGIIMLSTFIYSGVLLTFIGLNREVFREEQAGEAH